VTASPAGSLRQVLEQARALGLLGPGDPDIHIRHAGAFAVAAETRFGPAGPPRFLDPGTGAGVPGLVLALRWEASKGALVDASKRRCQFASEAIAALGLADRVRVYCERAEVLGTSPDLREAFELVVARSCAPPAVTAEWATPFLRVGGWLIVSEPPDGDGSNRWPEDAVDRLGLGTAHFERHDNAGVAVLAKASGTPDGYPRRVGIAAKRPRW
jgi:16S rRNA (guanine527-N7)-methyltransferase